MMKALKVFALALLAVMLAAGAHAQQPRSFFTQPIIGFGDNAQFFPGTTPINVTAGFYSPSVGNCNSGSACAPQLTIDRKLFVQAFQPTGTNFHIVCDSGCGGASSFGDNAAFTAGTTSINVMGGWYSSSATNCTSGDACAPQLTNDRKLFVQDFQGTSPWVVSGTFWQATQPVSIASMPSTPVTGTFWQTTQPVSGAFYQATQPVSIASMPSTSVTGTFWQTTQPVSGTVSAGVPALGQALSASSLPVVLPAAQVTTLTPPAAITGFALETGGNLAAIKADTDKIPAQGQALAAASMPVVLTAAQLTTLTPPAVFGGVVTQPTGSNLHVAVDSAPSTAVTNAGTFAVQAAQATAANLNATVVGPALTKGTQGAAGFSVQALKDAGRSYLTLTATAAAGVTSETLLSTSQNKAGTVTASVTSYTVTSGKTLRIQGITLSVRAGAAAVPFARLTLRSNTAGATTAASAVLYQIPEVFGISATIGVGGQIAIDIPDGLEIAGNGTVSIGLSHLDQATTNVINATLVGYEY
jgi:hypothetical protein